MKKMRLIPTNQPKDKLFNRRIFAYYGLLFSIGWFLMVFWTDVFITFEVAKVVAYLGVPATIAGLGFWEYLRAAKRSDEKETEENGKPDKLP